MLHSCWDEIKPALKSRASIGSYPQGLPQRSNPRQSEEMKHLTDLVKMESVAPAEGTLGGWMSVKCSLDFFCMLSGTFSGWKISTSGGYKSLPKCPALPIQTFKAPFFLGFSGHRGMESQQLLSFPLQFPPASSSYSLF